MLLNRITAFLESRYFFSKKEVRALSMVFLIMLAALLLPDFITSLLARQYAAEMVSEEDSIAISRLEKQIENNLIRPQEQEKWAEHVVVPINPNNATYPELLEAGIPAKQAAILVKYRSKGGYFKEKRDLLKIYGFSPQLLAKVEKYMVFENKIGQKNHIQYREKQFITQKITRQDLNKADSIQLEKIRGIGFKLAARIIKYRQRLGGFISEDQLYEVYGLDSATVKEVLSRFYVSPDFKPVQILISSENFKPMASHPYIGFVNAKAIAAWCRQHGNPKTRKEMEALVLPEPDKFAKAWPYLVIE